MAFVDPRATLERLNLYPGMKVLDVGAGSGAYALSAAQAVGESGAVYALDLQEDLLVKLKKEAERKGLHNLHVLHGDAERPGGSGLSENSVDAAILSNTLSQVENKTGVLEELRRALKAKARVLFIDRSPQGKLSGRGSALSEKEASVLFEAVGFALGGKVPAGDHHYGLIFQKI